MESLFLNIVNMSITASYIAIAVMILRFALKKAPKAFSCFMWLLVALRLVCPFSIESVLSLIPDTRAVTESVGNSSFSNAPSVSLGAMSGTATVGATSSDIIMPAETGLNVLEILAIVWVLGIVAMIVYSFASYYKIRAKVETSVKAEDNIKLCESIDTPFILGVFKPSIYIPFNTDEADKCYITSHEKMHLKRKDHIWKPLGFLLLSVYWFNPVLWVSYVLFCKDIELACDEKVIMNMDIESRKSYSNALVNCSAPRRLIAASPLAFGEVAVKTRIKSVLNYKKPAFWISILAVVAIVVTSVCFLTDPVSEKPEEPTTNTEETNKQEIPTTENNIPVVGTTEKATEKTTEISGKTPDKLNNKKPIYSSGSGKTTQKTPENDTTNSDVKDTTQAETELTTEKVQSTAPEIYPWGDTTDIVLTFTNMSDDENDYVKRRFSVPTSLLLDGYGLISYNYNDYMTYNDGKYNYLRLVFSRGSSPDYRLTLYYKGEKFRIYDIEGYEAEYDSSDWSSETIKIKTKYYDGSGNFLYKKDITERSGSEIYDTTIQTNDGWTATIHEEYFPDVKEELYTDSAGSSVTKAEFEAHLSTKKIR